MSKRRWRWLPNAFSLAVIVLMAANYFGPFGDLDHTWQVRTGEIIVRTGNIQPPDQFSYTIFGQDLPDFEWLYEVILWLTWDQFGYGGLKLLKTLLVGATLLLLAWRLRAQSLRWHGVTLALTLAVVVLSPAWNLRPLYCTTLGLLVVSGWLHDHCAGKKPLSWWLPVLMLVWSNCHPAVITGQALLLGTIGWEWLNRRWAINPPLDQATLTRLTAVGGVGVLASFLSPHPIERFLYPFRPELAHPIQRAFVEMQPLYLTLNKAPYTTGLIYAVAALVGLSIVLRFRQYRAWEIMLLGCLAILANTAARAAQDWLLIMLAVGLPHVVALLRQAARTDRRRLWVRLTLRCDSAWKRAWNSPLLRLQWGWPIAAALLLAAVSLIPPISRQMPIQDAAEWPTDAVAYLKQQGIHGRFFAPPDYGAFLTWKLGSDARCYTDTRGFFFPPLLLEDSHLVPQLCPDWQVRLDRIVNEYGTDYFVLETTGARGELWRLLQPAVGDNVVYLDQQTVVLRSDVVERSVRAIDLAKRKESVRKDY